MAASELKQRMAKAGVLMYDTAPYRIRLVTHLDVSREQILEAVARFKQVLMLT
jgi:acetylornithine/succinyldiaminopimelate/putrescine aminotransferase